MPLVNNIQQNPPQQIYYHMETTNQSFIDMHYYLKNKGIKNNAFFLILYDSGLAGVDPRDPNLTYDMKMRVLRECCANYWYFLREVVRIPVEGGTVGSGVRYKLHRGNLAMNFLFTLNYDMYVELPRQHFKTQSTAVRYLWIFNFGSTNSQIMFLHKDHKGSKDNLKRVKDLREVLPSYLKMDSTTGMNGEKLKAPNTVEALQHPINHNKITTFASAKSKEYANNLGRGCTMPLQYYDEFAFMPFNSYVYAAALPAFSKAAQNAKANHAPYGITITSTPGDLLTDCGTFAYQLRNNATPWNEMYYDYTYEQLEELRQSNTRSSFFLICYSYQQLGSGEQYFKDICVRMNNSWPDIRREVLLEWARVSSNQAFSDEQLAAIKPLTHDPIETIPFGRVGQYQFNIYEKLDLRYPPIIGVDVAGAMYQDSSAITVIDSKTTKVCATLNCNYIPSDDLADVIYTLVTKYMPNAIVNVERNGGFGISVIQRLCKTSIKKNLYYEIKDKVIEEQIVNGHTMKTTRRVKVYGTDSNKEVRARLIEILYDRAQYHKDKFIAPIIYNEMEAMEVKKSGKVEHSDKTHDDQVFSYLMALKVWYDGTDLAERYGITKNTIKTDEDVDIEDLNMETDKSLTKTDFKRIISDPEQDEVQNEVEDQLDELINTNKVTLVSTFNSIQHEDDMQCLSTLLNTDPVAKNAYILKNHIDPKEPGIDGVSDKTSVFVRLPDSIFSDFNDTDESLVYNDHITGNLAEQFRNLF